MIYIYQLLYIIPMYGQWLCCALLYNIMRSSAEWLRSTVSQFRITSSRCVQSWRFKTGVDPGPFITPSSQSYSLLLCHKSEYFPNLIYYLCFSWALAFDAYHWIFQSKPWTLLFVQASLKYVLWVAFRTFEQGLCWSVRQLVALVCVLFLCMNFQSHPNNSAIMRDSRTPTQIWLGQAWSSDQTCMIFLGKDNACTCGRIRASLRHSVVRG